MIAHQRVTMHRVIMLVGCLDQQAQVFAAILIIRKDVTLVDPALHDVHRQACNERSMLPSHSTQGAAAKR